MISRLTSFLAARPAGLSALAAMKPAARTAQPLSGEAVTGPPAYLNVAHKWADLIAGLVWTTVDGWFCTRCSRPVRHLTRRQRTQWLAQKRDPQVVVECRGVLPPFRKECTGSLVTVKAVAQ